MADFRVDKDPVKAASYKLSETEEKNDAGQKGPI